jgi:hypothetical protein
MIIEDLCEMLGEFIFISTGNPNDFAANPDDSTIAAEIPFSPHSVILGIVFAGVAITARSIGSFISFTEEKQG